MRLRDPQLLRKLVEHHHLPFATTTMAKGMIDEDHPLSIGCIERSCRQIQRRFLRSADLIVGLGYDTVEVEYEAWIGDTPLLQLDIEPPDVAPSVRLLHRAIGDLDAALTPPDRGAAVRQCVAGGIPCRASPRLPGGAAPAERVFHRPCRHRCGAPRAAA